jgi:amino acid permease
VPFYVLYYVCIRWAEVGSFFVMSVVAALFSLMGYGLLYWSTQVTDVPAEAVSLLWNLPSFALPGIIAPFVGHTIRYSKNEVYP